MSGWCPQWSSDEKICSRMVNNEVQFYEDNSFQAIANKIHMAKVANYSMAHCASKAIHVVTYVPGAKGGPSFTKMYLYPNFKDNQVIANKSFFQADSVEFKWNRPGNTVLLLTQADVSHLLNQSVVLCVLSPLSGRQDGWQLLRQAAAQLHVSQGNLLGVLHVF